MLEDIKGGSSKLDGCRPLAFIVFFREISFSTTIHPGNTLNIFIPLSMNSSQNEYHEFENPTKFKSYLKLSNTKYILSLNSINFY